jgi:ribosomal protein L37AE/L43A
MKRKGVVMKFKPTCKLCGDEFATARFKLGIAVCLDCGDTLAKERKFTVAPINKSNYMMITDMAMLKQLNPKRTA